MSILKPCEDGNVDTHVTIKKIKKMPFRINSQIIEEAFGIQVTFITEIKPPKEHFLAKKTVFLVTFTLILNHC